jgi:hypothetical protein
MHDDILLHVNLWLRLGMRQGIDIVVLGDFDMMAREWGRPNIGSIGSVDTVENVVEGKFYSGSRNAEPVRRGGPNAFPVVHTIRNRRCWIQKSRRIEIGGKKRRKKKRSGPRIKRRVGNNCCCCCCWGGFKAAFGKRLVPLVDVDSVHSDLGIIVYARRTSGGPYSLVGISLKLGRRFQIRFRSRSAPRSGYRIVDTEGKLHSFNGTGFRILTGFAAAFFLRRPLP